MQQAATVLALMVALLHLWFLVLEMFLWTRPIGLRTFRLTPEFAERSKSLAANQGLYNGFLAAGLCWGVWLGEAGHDITRFFLGCVVVAGIYGAVTVSRRIFYIQGLPALVALLLLR